MNKNPEGFNPHSILGLSMPTNEPDVAFDVLLPSLSNLKEVAPVTTFLINFQKPWTDELADKCISTITDKGFEVRHTWSSYDISKGVPFNKIRNDTSGLMPEAKYFAFLDDDMSMHGPSLNNKNSAGQQYVNIIHYMTTHPKCGLVLISGTLVRNIKKYHIAPIQLNSAYQTGKGFIMKNMYPIGYTQPFDAENLVGVRDESLAAAMVLSKGNYPARLPFGRINHYENVGTKKGKKYKNGNEMYNWLDTDVLINNNCKYIKDHYNPKFTMSASNFQVIDKDMYLNAGGIDVNDTEIRNSLDVSYEEAITNDLIEEIITIHSRG